MSDNADMFMVRCAWHYHVNGLTQAQVAERLSTTRRRVNELLDEAMRSGLTTVSINTPLALYPQLEEDLCIRFGLVSAIVVPKPDDINQLYNALGRATAEYLNRLLPSLETKTLGVGWGSTLRETSRYLRTGKSAPRQVCSMMGGLAQGSEINTFDTVRAYATQFDAESALPSRTDLRGFNWPQRHADEYADNSFGIPESVERRCRSFKCRGPLRALTALSAWHSRRG